MSCVICLHPRIAEINKSLVDGISERYVAVEFDLKKSSVHNHKIKCVQGDKPEGQGITPEASLQSQMDFLVAKSLEVVERCARCHKDQLLLKAIAMAIEAIEQRENLAGKKGPASVPARTSYEIVFKQGRPVAVQDAALPVTSEKA
jgi:hypothetical protein